MCSRSFTFRLETEKFLLHCLQLTTSLSSAHCASRNTCCASFKSSTFNFDLQTAPFAHLFFTYGDVTKLEGGARLLAEMRAEVAQCQFLFLARFPNLIVTRAKRFKLLQTLYIFTSFTAQKKKRGGGGGQGCTLLRVFSCCDSCCSFVTLSFS